MGHQDRQDGFSESETTGRTVIGLFAGRPGAEAAIRDLKDSGFKDDQIGVAHQDGDEQRDLLDATGATAAEGAATGALGGGVVGGLIGLLGSLLIPGVGPVVVGGVLASTLTGAGVGAATGGIIGALAGLGVPEEDARHFDNGLREGRILVTVHAGARTGEALAILERHGMDFGPSGAARYGTLDRVAGAMATAAAIGDPTLAGADYGNIASLARRERRLRPDPSYGGPERRLAGV
jgi:hypothetical protein